MKALVGILVAAVALVAVCTVVERRQATMTAVPDVLIGRWVTDVPAYADRYWELSRGTISWGKGGSARDTFGVLGVVEGFDEENRARIFEVHYQLEGEETTSVRIVLDTNQSATFGKREAISWIKDL